MACGHQHGACTTNEWRLFETHAHDGRGRNQRATTQTAAVVAGTPLASFETLGCRPRHRRWCRTTSSSASRSPLQHCTQAQAERCDWHEAPYPIPHTRPLCHVRAAPSCSSLHGADEHARAKPWTRHTTRSQCHAVAALGATRWAHVPTSDPVMTPIPVPFTTHHTRDG